MNSSVIKTIDEFVVNVGPIVFLVIGVIGNCLTFYILSKPKFLKESIFRYFLFSEIVSTLILLEVCAYMISKLLFNISETSSTICKIISPLIYTIHEIYPWISVLNSIDRFLCIKYKSRFKFIKKFKNQALAVVLIFIFFILINIPRSIFSESTNNEIKCAMNDRKIGLFMNISHLIISNLIPFFIMLCCTFLLLHFMVSHKKRLQQNIEINFNREKDFVKGVLTMDLWFLVLYTPLCLMKLSIYSLDFNSVNLEIWKLCYDTALLLTIIEASCNIFLYYFCNILFRDYLHSIVRC